ncbi:MAG TPA: polysaccharide deacetylase family protein [Xanthobacteraceae bacterium]|nr:polysaccharide deacetylase family protein [Xanthobacteraceae bacterium]
MRLFFVVIAAVATLGLAAFGVVATQQATVSGGPILFARNTSAPPASAHLPPASLAAPAPLTATAAPPVTTAAEPTQIAQAQISSGQIPSAQIKPTAPAAPAAPAAAATTNATPPNSAKAANGIPACDKPGGMGLERIVQIDTTGGPAFGFEHFKQYDFLREGEVVLTFDDGPWPVNTPMVIKALTDQCVKGTFFEIGEHATWHPELSKLVAQAGMTIGSHTWSHKDLAKNPYASDIEQAKQEIEMGVSAVTRAAGAPIAPFFRFPDLQQPPEILAYLGTRNISTFSTDIDSFDWKIHRPELVIQSVMTKLKKRGKGIVLMHDFQRGTAEALPELLRQLKANGFKVVHMVPAFPVTTIAKYDDMVRQQDKMDVTNTRPQSSVVKTISGD